MAISPAVIPDPIDAEVSRLEARIDKILMKRFRAEASAREFPIPIWSHGITILNDHHRVVADKLVDRYQAVGWRVRWVDGNDGTPGVAAFHPTLMFMLGTQGRQSPPELDIDDDRLWTTWVV